LIAKLLETATPSSAGAAANVAASSTTKQKTVSISALPAPALQGKARKASAANESSTKTEGVNVQALSLKVGTRDISYLLYDFAGREEYYPTHRYFLSGRPLFVLCFNAMEPKMDQIEYWYRTIKWVGGTSPQVILVGTHADNVKDEKVRANALHSI